MWFKRRRCWYCHRVGRFGWKRRKPWQGAECKNDKECFRRVYKYDRRVLLLDE